MWNGRDAVLGFPRSNKPGGFALLLGSTRDGVVVDAIQSWDWEMPFSSFVRKFEPKALSHRFDFPDESIQVGISHELRFGRNFYMADIHISHSATS